MIGLKQLNASESQILRVFVCLFKVMHIINADRLNRLI